MRKRKLIITMLAFILVIPLMLGPVSQVFASENEGSESTGPDGTDPDGTDPDGIEPDGTDPDGTDPDGTDPDGTEPDGTDPDGTDPDGTDPDGTEPDGTEPDGTEPDGTEPDGTEPDSTEPDSTEPDDDDGTYTVTFVYPEILVTSEGINDGEANEGDSNIGGVEGMVPHGLSRAIIATFTVEEGEAVEPPENFDLPEGYDFAGWDSDAYLNVAEDLTVEAILKLTVASRAVSPFSVEPSVNLVFTDYATGEEFTDFDEWDYYKNYAFALNLEITPKTGEGSGGQTVVLEAPEGMRFTVVTGNTDGITSKALTNNNRTATLTMDSAYLSNNISAVINTSLYLAGVYLPADKDKGHSISAYRTRYLAEKGRPEFTVTAALKQSGATLGEEKSFTLKPKAYADPENDAFDRFGIYEYVQTVNPAANSVREYNSIYIGKDAVFYRGTGAGYVMTSYFQIVLREKKSTDLEPVWNISYKMYLPDMITVAPAYEKYLKYDGEKDQWYFLVGGEGGYQDYKQVIPRWDYSAAVDDLGTVLYINQNIGLRLRDEVNQADYNGQTFTGNGLVISYDTVAADGAVESYTQTMDGFTFIFADIAKIDRMTMGVAGKYQSGGFVLSREKLSIDDHYVGLSNAYYDNSKYIHETHKEGTLTFKNEGGYFIDAIHYSTQAYGELTVQYYTKGEPDTAKDISPTSTGEFTRTLTFDGQTQEDYITEVIFTFTDGHIEDIYYASSSFKKNFSFDMHGFTGLTPNVEGDDKYHHSGLIAELRGKNGCGGEGVDVTGSNPAVQDGAHTLIIPVKISLTTQDTLTLVISGKGRGLSGDINYNATNPQIFLHMGYDSRDASGNYIDDVSARAPYTNFRLEVGTQDPYRPDCQDSQLMVSRIRGAITLDASLHYRGAKFVYTTKNGGNTEHTIALADNGDPDNMAATGGTAQTVTLNLDTGDYITSMEFHAESMRVTKYSFGHTGGSDITNPDFLSGYRGLKGATYWSYNSVGDTVNNHITFSTGYERAFPDGTAIIAGRYYNVFAEMSADNMNDGTTPRSSLVAPRAWGGSNYHDYVGTSFTLVSEGGPGAVGASVSPSSVLQGNTFNYMLSIDASNSYILDGKVWLELVPGFAYLGNNSGLNVTQKKVDGKTYLCIEEAAKFYNNAKRTWTLKFQAFTLYPGAVKPVANIWYDATETYLQRETLAAEWPYRAFTYIYYADTSAPHLNEKYTKSEQVLMKTSNPPTIQVGKNNATGVTLIPGVSGTYNPNGTVSVRPSNTGDLSMLVAIGSDATGMQDFTLSLDIPRTAGGDSAIPLFLTGEVENLSIPSGVNLTVTYFKDNSPVDVSGYTKEQFAEIDKIEITINALTNDTVLLDLPLMTTAAKNEWNMGAQASISGPFSYTASGSNNDRTTQNAVWQLEDIDANVIKGTLFQDRNYDNIYNTGDSTYSVKVDLYRSGEMDTPFRTGTFIGSYTFSNLPDGDYVVRVHNPKAFTAEAGGYEFSAKQTSDPGSKVGADGYSDTIHIEDFQTVSNIHAGLQYKGIIKVDMIEHGTSNILKTQFVNVKFNTAYDLTKNGFCVSPLTLPENYAVHSSSANVSQAASSNWSTTQFTKTIDLIWNGPTYTVSFAYKDRNGDPVDVPAVQQKASVTVRSGSNANISLDPAPAPTSTAYSYVGYRVDDDATINTGTTFTRDNVTSDIVITYVYEAEYTVTFNTDGGTPVPVNQTITSGGLVTEPATAPVKADYVFAKWFKESTFANKWVFATDTVTGNTTIYARWFEKLTIDPVEEDDYTVSGTGEPDSEITVTFPNGETETTKVDEDGKWEVPVPDGVDLKPDDVIKVTVTDDDDDEIEDGSIIVIASLYTVSFNSNGGSNVPSQQIAKGGKVAEPSDPTRDGFTLEGWYSDAALTTKWSFDINTVTGNMTLYARWTVSQYTVTFDSNGGSYVAPQTVSPGETVTRPSNPTRAGYTFSGWYLNSAAYNFATPVTSSFTLTAMWTANSGSGGDSGGGDGGGTTIIPPIPSNPPTTTTYTPPYSNPTRSSINSSDSTYTPIGNQPVPLSEMPNLTDIFDDDVPLSALPQTGNLSTIFVIMMGASLTLILIGASIAKRRKLHGEY